MGTSGIRDCQRASRSALKDFTDDEIPYQRRGNCYFMMLLRVTSK